MYMTERMFKALDGQFPLMLENGTDRSKQFNLGAKGETLYN